MCYRKITNWSSIMKTMNNFKLLTICMIIIFSGSLLYSTQLIYFNNESNQDHEHEEGVHSSRIIIDPPPSGSPPPPPTLYQPTSPDFDGSITLSWSAASGATSYKIYRSTSASGTYQYIGSTTGLSYTNERPMGVWWYKVRARNYYGTSSFSNRVSVNVILGVKYYHINDGVDISDRDTWDSEYVNWLEDSRQTATATGRIPSNIFSAVFQPTCYTHTLGADYYDLEYALNVHVETDPGDAIDGWPQPSVELDDEEYYCKPFVVSKVTVTTTLLDLVPIYWLWWPVGYKSNQPPQNRLWVYEATQNTFLGNYHSDPESDMYNEVWNGGFWNSDYWEPYGTEKGSISYSNSYGYDGGGVRIQNNVGGSMGIYNNEYGIDYKIYFPDGRRNVNINYWGKRSSGDPGTNVGVKLLVEYKDGTNEWCFPDELRLLDRTGVWTHHQYSLETTKDIDSVLVYAVNDEMGTAFFDTIFVPYGEWHFDPKGDWPLADYGDDNYDTWIDNMNSAIYHNNVLDSFNLAIGLAGLLVPGTLGSILGLGGYLLNAFGKAEIINLDAQGSVDNQHCFDAVYDYNFGVAVDNGLSTVIACDNTMAFKYDLYASDLINLMYRSIAIKVKVEWASPSTIFEGSTGGYVYDTAETTFIVNCLSAGW